MTALRGPWMAAPLLLVLAACGKAPATPAQSPAPQRAGGYPQPYHLLPLFTLNNTRLTQTAALMEKTGNAQEKAAAGAKLVQLAEWIATDQWRESQRPVIMSMQAQASPLTRSDAHLQLDDWQKRHMVRVYNAMSALGGEVVLTHCRAVANASDRRRGQQLLALAVLGAHDETKKGQGNAWAMPTGPGLLASGNSPLPNGTTFAGPTVSGASRIPAPEAPRVEGGTIINVNEVVAALWPYFYVCYQRAYQEHGRFGAWVILNARVSGDGSVASVDSKGDESIPFSMMNCLKDVARQARFAPPKGDPTVFIPLSFVPDPRWETPAAAPAPAAPPPAAPAPVPAGQPPASAPQPAPAAGIPGGSAALRQ